MITKDSRTMKQTIREYSEFGRHVTCANPASQRHPHPDCISGCESIPQMKQQPSVSSLSVAARPRNPRFKDAHTGTKRRLDVKTSNLDSGISGSGRSWVVRDSVRHMCWWRVLAACDSKDSRQVCEMIQPSATHPHFGQTCLFTNFLNISTTIRVSKFRWNS